MDRRISLAAGACAAAIAMPHAARAQALNYYTPPKLKSQGTNQTAVGGAGIVVVKVLVDKSGTGRVQGVIRSTNHADDAAALEIAKSSTYRPATKGTTVQTAFYDFTLKFTGKGSGASDASSSPAGLAMYESEIRNGKYDAAQKGLKSYIAAHPDDSAAQLQLGVASAFLSDSVAAAAAFDKAGSIPSNYKALAAKAYNDAAGEEFKKPDYAAATAAAKRAVEFAPGPFTYNTLGTAEDAAGDHASAIADLEKARSLAAADSSMKAADKARIDVNLVSAYVNADKPDAAKPIVAETAKIDPSQIGAGQFLANYYAKSANDLLTAGKTSAAAAMFEQAAAAAPSQAVRAYVNAAFAYLNEKPTAENDKAKADADKALAIDPDDATANFAAGVALANQPGKTKDALVFLNHADASAKKGSDANLTARIEDIIKQIDGTKK